MARSRQVGELIRPTIRGTSFPEDQVGTEVAPTSVPTFEHVGLYWTPDGGGAGVSASVEYRVSGEGNWIPGYPLWFDARNDEYRGIIRGLAEDTTYQARLTLSTGGFTVHEFTTWTDSPTIASTINIACGTDAVPRTTGWNTTLAGSEGTGYVLYTPTDPLENVLDIPLVDFIQVSHNYVIIDGFKLKNPARWGFYIPGNRNHIRIQNCEISGWGTENTDPLFKGIGADYDAGVFCSNTAFPVNQVVVQRCHIHSPRWDSNSYLGAPRGAITVSIASPAVASQVAHGRSAGDAVAFRTTGTLPTGMSPFQVYYVLATGLTADAFRFSLTDGGAAINTSGTQSGVHSLIGEGAIHPEGPYGITISSSAASNGNNVIRDNTINSENGHYYNDGMGGSPNFSLAGFSGKDSFIGRNIVMHVMDDGIEAEGGGQNTLVEGNYVSETFTGISSCAVGKGPLYIYRNIFDVTHTDPYLDPDDEFCGPLSPASGTRGPFGKLGDAGGFGLSRRFYLHNTLLQRSGAALGRGASSGPSSSGGKMSYTVGRNNIWQVLNTNYVAIRDTDTVGTGNVSNDFDYEIRNGNLSSPAPDTLFGTNLIDIERTPVFDTTNGHGNDAAATGKYQLHSSSPGYGQAEPLPNFNGGAGSDVGAAQHGDPPMSFGCPW